MSTYHVSVRLLADVVIEVSAQSIDEATRLVDDKLIVSASLVDTDADRYTVVEDSIVEIWEIIAGEAS